MNNTISFNDIFKSSFLENQSSISIIDMVIALVLSFVVGLFIMLIYKKTFKGVMYSYSFCVSLLAMTLITTLIILAVTSNVVLSLGMVGALSIVRFRSAIKEPLDIAFLFWSISVGIVLGAGFIPLGILGSLFIGLIMILFVNKDTKDNPYILVLSCEDDISEKKAIEFTQNKVKKQVVKSKTVSSDGIEITVEIRLKDMTTEFINEVSKIPGIKSAVLVSYNGDYMG
ncbi:DUF4956 domain-containing protein [Anaerovorax odorimutans]|uniref:DUF4956 domain-containing protein n=1 Tax=Anaerovorax odorimutans TaxID=109327 RepID=UPI0003FF0E19|nr:DUF4956 domain-containing protein [Anaerovorax odorimutans]